MDWQRGESSWRERGKGSSHIGDGAAVPQGATIAVSYWNRICFEARCYYLTQQCSASFFPLASLMKDRRKSSTLRTRRSELGIYDVHL
jgi:hypothetical protein